MRSIIASIIALFLIFGIAGAVTFEKPHTEKHVELGEITHIDVNLTGEDSTTTYNTPHQYVTGIDSTQYFGGIDHTFGLDWFVWYAAEYNNGNIGQYVGGSGSTPESGFYNAMWYPDTPNDQAYVIYGSTIVEHASNGHPLPYAEWEQLNTMHYNGYDVVNGVMYDKYGNVLHYYPGVQEGTEIGGNPSSNPAIPDNSDAVAYTTGDFTDPA